MPVGRGAAGLADGVGVYQLAGQRLKNAAVGAVEHFTL